jgi:hypothetical protein
MALAMPLAFSVFGYGRETNSFGASPRTRRPSTVWSYTPGAQDIPVIPRWRCLGDPTQFR